MFFEIIIPKPVQKQLNNLPPKIKNQIFEHVSKLAGEPRPAGSKKLQGYEAWRIRVGNYRIIYEIEEGRLLIILISIAHRKDIYKKM
ncbi:MAG: type II toxin-antitoxin system RelE/ParE family toxin [Ignavibacteriaceae bacterium]|nr:type II toxin-antitoxin system RelE/ParE family toxin [Ignavibacteriaceae bacterium]